MNKKSTLRSVANDYLTHPKSRKGITLIALVITIIILLILAGISISMLSGDNSILQKATDAKTNTERTSIIEQARIDILGQIAENKGENITKQQLKSILNSYFDNNEVSTLNIPNDISTSNDELTSIEGNYKIKLSEIYNGKFTENIIKVSVSELREGDEVIYTDGNGNEIPCIVLYDSTGSYGIQVITKDLAKDSGGNDVIIELGNGTKSSSMSTDSTSFAIAKESYNTAIATLNNAAREYLNTNLATSARCVGSNPSETPVTSEDNTGTYTNTYSYFNSPTNYNNQFKLADTITDSTPEDYSQMKKSNINCHNISKLYWLASRHSSAYASGTYFNMREVPASGICTYVGICGVGSSSGMVSRSFFSKQ